jgi:M6 family metalloprotease-like protein
VTTPQTFASRLFGDGTGVLPYDSLRNFYLRSSYDQLTIEGNVLGWYTTPYARSTVTETTQGRQALIKEALDYYDQQGHDFAQYDNDGDGAIDYFCVFWAGPHGEWASFWWGYYTSFSDSTYRLDGKRLRSYSWQWELYNYPNGSFNSKTVIHETGHALGLPDYYDYDDDVGPRGGVGGLDIMDSSGDHNCFSKFMLDWIEPVVVSAGSRTLQLRGSGIYPDAVLFMPSAVPGQIFAEFFMVQNRHRTGNDTGLFTGSDGLVVWHVDSTLNSSGTNFLYNNSYTEHKLLKLVQADGLEQIETFDASADAGDYYKAGMTLGPLTMPNTDRYDGTATGMGITNITGTTSPMSLTVFSSDDLPVCGILSPADGQTVYGTVPVDVSAGDDVGISRVELYAGGVLRSTLTAPPYAFSLDTTVLDNGTRLVEAVAYDTILQTASSLRLSRGRQPLRAGEPQGGEKGEPQFAAPGVRRRPDLERQRPQYERRLIPGLHGERGGAPAYRRGAGRGGGDDLPLVPQERRPRLGVQLRNRERRSGRPGEPGRHDHGAVNSRSFPYS